jgi:hypothetical protein
LPPSQKVRVSLGKDDGEWKVKSEKWKVEMENGKWKMES